MSDIATAFVGAKIFDGRALLDQHALAITHKGRFRIVGLDELPKSASRNTLKGGLISPGFVDLQVNGGGGVMFNDDQSVDALRRIASAHAALGTEAILPTLITDTPGRTQLAIAAVEQAMREKVPGIIGIHLEGPHLSVARKGAHDAQLIRPMTGADLDLLLEAADRLPNVKVTLAPESVTVSQIKALADTGILVSLGHTDADYATCMKAFDAGATCATHLFNAMSQMGNREPGLVGAVLARDDVHAGIIADGIHVHPTMIRIALDAKRASEKLFLVTDAMATAGSKIASFTLNGRKIMRQNRTLTLADGTLAGADLDMRRAMSVLVDEVGESIASAVKRATSVPTSLLSAPGKLGHLTEASEQAIYIEDGQPVSQIRPKLHL